ncbi:MAG: hypothetical protein SCARUB_05272, partial [Candidatus Scalindua rubra]
MRKIRTLINRINEMNMIKKIPARSLFLEGRKSCQSSES